MQDFTPVVIGLASLAFVIVAVVAIVKANRRSGRADHDRVARILQLLEAIAMRETNTHLYELHELVRGKPTPPSAAFLAPAGWFDRSKKGLAKLLSIAQTSVVEWFFVFFTPSMLVGSRQELLTWFHEMVMLHRNDLRILEAIAGIIERMSIALTQPEADWLYARALETVQSSNSTSPARTFALRIGRMRYSRSRPNRVPTVYDEQAIANDIAARVS